MPVSTVERRAIPGISPQQDKPRSLPTADLDQLDAVARTVVHDQRLDPQPRLGIVERGQRTLQKSG